MKTLVFLLLLANLTLFGYTRLDATGAGEGARLGQQVQPDKIKLLTAQQVAALGPDKMAALADVCMEWGPMQDADKLRALARLESLDLGKLLSQKKVEVITNYWVFLPPVANKAAADKRLAELKANGVTDVATIDNGPQRFATSLGMFRTEDLAQARLADIQQQGYVAAKLAARAQSVQETLLVVRDPPAPAVARVKELQTDFPGSDVRVGSCDRPA
jgi:hypothetical protein